MMLENSIRLNGNFSIREQINMKDVSQIFTHNLVTVRKWNRLILEKFINSGEDDISVHICPWYDSDWEYYFQLVNPASNMVIWRSEQMPPIKGLTSHINVVKYQASDPSERFVVITSANKARALISWEQATSTQQDTTFMGVLISSPVVSRTIATTLDNKIRKDQF